MCHSVGRRTATEGGEEEEEIWQNKSGRGKKGPPDAGRLLNTRRGEEEKSRGDCGGGDRRGAERL